MTSFRIVIIGEGKHDMKESRKELIEQLRILFELHRFHLSNISKNNKKNNFVFYLFFPFLLLSSSIVTANEPFTQKQLEQHVRSLSDNVSGSKSFIEFEIDGIHLTLLSSVEHDRMRVISPIINYSALSPTDIETIMTANFHSALDARYAVSNGKVFSAYIHPLSTLTEDQLTSAILQVVNLKLSFGTTYSSSTITYGN